MAFGFHSTDKQDQCSAPTKEDLAKELLVDPDSLDSVASAYRYKVALRNEELAECDLEFEDKAAVFSFQEVEKKRALKKEEWPLKVVGSSQKLFTVKLQLFAGDTEITDCTGCCPKFHGFSKQFRLVITVTSKDKKEVFKGGLDINRKKFSKKRNAEECSSDDILPNKAPRLCMDSLGIALESPQLLLTPESQYVLSQRKPDFDSRMIDSRMFTHMSSHDSLMDYPMEPMEPVEPRPKLIVSPISARFPFPTPPDLTYFPPRYAPKELVSSHYVCDLISNNQAAQPNKGISMHSPNPRYQWDQVFPELYDNHSIPHTSPMVNYQPPNNNWNYPPVMGGVCTKPCCAGPTVQEVCVDDFLVPEMPATPKVYPRQTVNFSMPFWGTA